MRLWRSPVCDRALALTADRSSLAYSVDIPLQSLHLLFNVNHSIVSQVNPHVHLFFFAPKGSAGRPVAHRKGKGWRGGFLLSGERTLIAEPIETRKLTSISVLRTAMEQYLKLELTKNFKVIRDL